MIVAGSSIFSNDFNTAMNPNSLLQRMKPLRYTNGIQRHATGAALDDGKLHYPATGFGENEPE